MIDRLRRLTTRGAPVLADATMRDAPAIAALHGAAFHRGWSEHEIEQMLTDRAVLCLVARPRRGPLARLCGTPALVGFVLIRRAADEAEILSIAVAARWQRRGLGRQLLDRALGRLAGLGTRTLFLEVDEHNTPARRLYARRGFVEVGRREGYYRDASGRSATALVLRRAL